MGVGVCVGVGGGVGRATEMKLILTKHVGCVMGLVPDIKPAPKTDLLQAALSASFYYHAKKERKARFCKCRLADRMLK